MKQDSEHIYEIERFPDMRTNLWLLRWGKVEKGGSLGLADANGYV